MTDIGCIEGGESLAHLPGRCHDDKVFKSYLAGHLVQGSQAEAGTTGPVCIDETTKEKRDRHLHFCTTHDDIFQISDGQQRRRVKL